MDTATHTMQKSVPLYDLFDGLGRRRRLLRSGYDPDVLVEADVRNNRTVHKEHAEAPLEGEAAA